MHFPSKNMQKPRENEPENALLPSKTPGKTRFSPRVLPRGCRGAGPFVMRETGA